MEQAVKEYLAEMKKVFEEKFGKKAERSYFSPGRVNLIGEHTDYNGGHSSRARFRSARMPSWQTARTARRASTR